MSGPTPSNCPQYSIVYIVLKHFTFSFSSEDGPGCSLPKSVPWIFRKPNKRVEVIRLGDVMDAMLERAGVETEDYVGPTKVTASQSSLWLRVCPCEAELSFGV